MKTFSCAKASPRAVFVTHVTTRRFGLFINNEDFGILILIIFSKTMDASNADTRLLVSEEREIKFFWLKISF